MERHQYPSDLDTLQSTPRTIILPNMTKLLRAILYVNFAIVFILTFLGLIISLTDSVIGLVVLFCAITTFILIIGVALLNNNARLVFLVILILICLVSFTMDQFLITVGTLVEIVILGIDNNTVNLFKSGKYYCIFDTSFMI